MQREVRSVKSADGTRIAYSTYGPAPGVPLVQIGNWFVTDGLCLESPSMRPWYEGLAGQWPLVTFDNRGTGDSQRDVDDVSMDAQLADLDAVVTAVGLDRFHLMGHGSSAPVVATFAAQHPDRIESLVLTSIAPRSMDILDPRALDGLMGLIRTNWPLAVRTLVEATSWKYAPFEVRRDAYRAVSHALSPEAMAKYLQFTYDVTSHLPLIQVPTLVLQGSAPRRVVEASRAAATLIPDARFVQVREESDEGEVTRQLELIRHFLGEPKAAATAALPHGTAIILFTDIVDSTPLTERMGDTAFRDKSRRVDEDVRAAIREAGGTPVDGKVLGDGVMGVFTSATQAIQAARRCVEASGELPLHIGLHAGDVISEGDNVYGGAVNIASRVCGLCAPGEILVTATVRDLARTSAGVTFEDRGEREMKGIGEPIRVFAVWV